MLRIVLALFGLVAYVSAGVWQNPASSAGSMHSSKFRGASGHCTSSGVYVSIDMKKMLHRPDKLELKVIGRDHDRINAKIAHGSLSKCLPKFNPKTQIAVYKFKFEDCPTEPFMTKNGSIIVYKYMIMAMINHRDIKLDDPNAIFRANREALTVSCELDGNADSGNSFVPKVESQLTEIENTSHSKLITELFLGGLRETKVELSKAVPLGESVFADVHFSGQEPSIFIAVEDCTVSTKISQHHLIKKGCPADPTTHIMIKEIEASSFKQFAFSFESFSFTNQLGATMKLDCTAKTFPTIEGAKKQVESCGHSFGNSHLGAAPSVVKVKREYNGRMLLSQEYL